MNAGQALWLDESTGAESPRSGSPVPVSGLRAVEPSVAPRPAEPAASRRSQLETLPCAGVILAMEEPAELPTPSERERQKLSWCIDFGEDLRTMSTFELWTALEKGEVSADLRVWREGMECWMPIARVPSLAVALLALSPLTTPSPSPATATTGPAPEVGPRSAGPRSVGRPVPAPLLPSAPPPPVPRRFGRSLARTLLHPGTLWMALGSGVAAGAITAALMGVGRPAARPLPSPTAVAVLAAVAPPPRPAAPTPAPAPEVLAGAPDPITIDGSRAHHDELGQHRLRRGKKPARAR